MNVRLLQLLKLKNLHLKHAIGFLYDELDSPFIRVSDMRHLPNALNSLKDRVDSCLLCELSKNNGKPSFGACSPKARVVFVSDIPLVDADNPTKMLGRSGILLSELLAEFALALHDVSFLSLLKCQPKPHVKLDSQLFSACKPYILKQLELLTQSAVVVVLGETVYKNLIGSGDFSRYRGQKISWQNRTIIATHSLSSLLRNPSLRAEMERDFCLIRSLL